MGELERFSTSRHEELSLDQVTDYPPLARALAVWQKAVAQHGIPTKLDPLSMDPRVLPYVMLLRLEPDGPRLRIEMAGTAACEKHGGELKGRTTDDFFAPTDAAPVVQAAQTVAASGTPSLARREYITLSDRRWRYVRLIMPLSSDGSTIDRFYKVLDPTTLQEVGGALGTSYTTRPGAL